MTISEFARKELKNLKGKPLKDKLEHIATYYWIPIVTVVALAVFVGFISHQISTKKETVLFGYCINASENQHSVNFPKEFAAHAQIGEDQEALIIPNLRTTDVAFGDTMQALSVHVAAADVDFIATDIETARTLVQTDFFCDLSEKLTDEQLQKLSPYLLYAERKELPADNSPNTQAPPLPKLAKADELTDPVPVALNLKTDSLLSKAYTFPEGDLVLLIMHNAPHMDMLQSFLDYIIA